MGRIALAGIMCSLMLAACQTVQAPAPPPVVTGGCPLINTYTPAQDLALEAQIKALNIPNGSPLATVIVEDHRLFKVRVSAWTPVPHKCGGPSRRRPRP